MHVGGYCGFLCGVRWRHSKPQNSEPHFGQFLPRWGRIASPIMHWFKHWGRTPPACGPSKDPKWARPGSRYPISKFRDPLITFERIELSASNSVQTYRAELYCVCTIKRLLIGSRDPIPKFWYLLTSFERCAMRFKFGTDIKDAILLRAVHKSTPRWAWPGSRDPISKCWAP